MRACHRVFVHLAHSYVHKWRLTTRTSCGDVNSGGAERGIRRCPAGGGRGSILVFQAHIHLSHRFRARIICLRSHRPSALLFVSTSSSLFVGPVRGREAESERDRVPRSYFAQWAISTCAQLPSKWAKCVHTYIQIQVQGRDAASSSSFNCSFE